jgi:hypothetical protein
VAKKGFG